MKPKLWEIILIAVGWMSGTAFGIVLWHYFMNP